MIYALKYRRKVGFLMHEGSWRIIADQTNHYNISYEKVSLDKLLFLHNL